MIKTGPSPGPGSSQWGGGGGSTGPYSPGSYNSPSSSGGGGGSNPLDWLKKITWKKVAPGLAKAGQIAAAIAKSRADKREAEIKILQDEDRLRLLFEQNRRSDDQSKLDFEQNRRSDDQARLDFERFNLQAPQFRSRNAVRGDIMAGVQDVELTRPRGGPGVRGGVRPSLLSPDSRELGRQMARQALLSQMQGNLSPTAPGTGPVQPSAPGSGPLQPTPLPNAGKLDKVLTGAGAVGLAAGTVGGGTTGPYGPQQGVGGPGTGPSATSQTAGMPVSEASPGMIVPDEDEEQFWPPQKSRLYVNPSLGAKFYAPQF